MTVSFVGFKGRSQVLFVAACVEGEIVEVFEGSIVSELEWMILWVLPFLLQGFSVVIVDVAAERVNFLCFVPLRWQFALFCPVIRVGSKAAGWIFGCGFKVGDLARFPPMTMYPCVSWN